MTHLAGLRGLAILLVILYHLNGDIINSGYLGVDIFLVISGYLLFLGVGKDEISPKAFIEKKVIRIVPSLAVMVFLTILASCCILNTETALETVAITGWTALLGYSNFYLQDITTDYFAAAANLNPFLHSWYLSITLQVYVLWCLCAWSLRKFCSRITGAIVILVAVASFVYTHLFQLQEAAIVCGLDGWGQTEDVSYFATFPRIWEVLAGGLVLVLPSVSSGNKRFIASMAGVVGLIIALGCSTELGGKLSVILTVFSTVLLLKYVPATSLDKVFSNKGLLWLGKISFSWYLVHFPIFVLTKTATTSNLGLGMSCALLLTSVLVAYVMWFVVERRKFSLLVSLLIWSASAVLAYLTSYTSCVQRIVFDDSEPQYPIYTREIPRAHESLYDGFVREVLIASGGIMGCMKNELLACPELVALGDPTKPASFVLIGDSNAQQLYSGLNELAYSTGHSGVQVASIILPFWNRYVCRGGKIYLYDRAKGEAFMQWLSKHPELKTVFIGQLWDVRMKITDLDWNKNKVEPTYENNEPVLAEFCEKIKSMGKQVVLIAPTPIIRYDSKRFTSGLAYMRWRCKQPRGYKDEASFVLTSKQYQENNQRVFDMFARLEKKGLCRCLHIEKGMFPDGEFRVCRGKSLYMKDVTHITPPVAIELFREVKKEFIEIVTAPVPAALPETGNKAR